jgi:hypothetical protein
LRGKFGEQQSCLPDTPQFELGFGDPASQV